MTNPAFPYTDPFQFKYDLYFMNRYTEAEGRNVKSHLKKTVLEESTRRRQPIFFVTFDQMLPNEL